MHVNRIDKDKYEYRHYQYSLGHVRTKGMKKTAKKNILLWLNAVSHADHIHPVRTVT